MKIPLFQGIFTPYDPSFYGIFSEHLFCQYWSKLCSFVSHYLAVCDPISCDTPRARYPEVTQWPHIARYSDAIAAIPHIARYFLREVSTPPKWCDTPPWYLILHRHIRAIPHFATYRAIVVRYPIKTSTKQFCHTIATSIARYEKYRCSASKPVKWPKSNEITLLNPFAAIGPFSGPEGGTAA